VSNDYRFEADIRALQKDLESMADQAPAILARALNRAGVSGQTAMVRAITADTGLAAKDVKREIALDKATRSFPLVRLTIKGRRLPLVAFQARGPEPSRGRGKGVSYRLPTGRGRVPDAFIATMKSGHRGVFKRKAKKRLAIIELQGPSLPHVFEKKLAAFQEAAQASLIKNLEHDISFARQPAAESTEGA
jgi:hypothetical protein